MFANHSRVSVAFGLVLSVLMSGIGQAVDQQSDAGPNSEIPRPGLDRYGDPLPPGALMRLGTRRHRVQVWPLSWHSLPDGQSYLTHQQLGDRAEIHRLDVVTGRLLETWPVPDKYHAVGFSPDGRRVFLANQFVFFTNLRPLGQNQEEKQEWVLTYYDLAHRQPVWTNRALLKPSEWMSVDPPCFSPEGKWFARADALGGLRLWDAATGTEVWHQKNHEQPLQPLGFTPDRRILVVRGREDSTIYLVDRATGKNQRSFPTQHEPHATGWTLAPDGSAVLFGHYSPNVRAWDLATGKEQPPLHGHKEWVYQVAFSPDGRTLVTGGNDKFVVVRDWPSGKVVRTINLGNWCIKRMAVSPDGRRLEVRFWDDQALHFYDLSTGKAQPTPQNCHRASVYGLAFAPDGALLSYGRDATVRTWDIKQGEAVGSLGVDRNVNDGSFALSADGRLLATSNSIDNTIYVRERATGKVVHKLPADNAGNYPVFSPDGRWLAAVDNHTGLLQTWEVATGRAMLKLEQNRPADGISCAFSPDGRRFAAWDEGWVRFWTTASWQKQASPDPYAPLGLTFSPDGRTLATASVEGIRLWELAAYSERAHIHPEGFPRAGTLQFSPTGRWLAWVNDHRTIHVWDIYRGNLLGPFIGHEDTVTGLAFTPDERALASSSDDTTILLWDLAGAVAKQPPSRTGDIDQAWQTLAGDDAKAAWQAIRLLLASPTTAVQRMADQLKPAVPIEPKHIESCLRDLDSDRFPVRDRATRTLEQMGDPAAPALKQFLTTNPPLEPRRRVERLLARMSSGLVRDPQRLRQIRALEVLEQLRSADARRLLESLAKGAPEAGLTRGARAALQRLERRASWSR